MEVHNQVEVDRLPARLGLGEREAIILAEERGCPLLVDDRTARREAGERGITFFGSLRVLKEAKEQEILVGVSAALRALRDAGLHMNESLCRAFLKEMDE